MQRVEQSLKNTVVSLGIQVGTILMNFISRTVLIQTLGEQYLGINGLFSNILTMLSLVELGVGSALIYLMYKPMAENDEERLGMLMSAYAKIYTFIGIIILAIGVVLTPFLGFFMKESPDIENLTLIYILYVLNVAVTYFFSYRASIINVAQKNYIVNLIKFKFTVIQYVLQIAVLIIFKNYVLYYVCAVIFTVLGNWAVYLKAGKMFPFIKVPAKGRLEKSEKNKIKKNIFAMSFHRLGTFIVFGTDNLIISKFVGIVEVGLYSNYTMVTNALTTAINLLFTSITASIGNLVNHEEKEKSYTIFKNVFFANNWIVVFCCVCLYVLFNPFIRLWVGEKYTFDNIVVAVIVFNFYLTHIRLPANVFKEAAGLFWNDRYKSIVESIVNLVFSLFLVGKWGILGVFVGTTISTLTVCFWVEPYVLYKHYFKRNVLEYFQMFIKYLVVGLLSVALILTIAEFIVLGVVGEFLFKIVLCILVPNLLYLILFYRTNEFAYFKGILLNVMNRITKKNAA